MKVASLVLVCATTETLLVFPGRFLLFLRSSGNMSGCRSVCWSEKSAVSMEVDVVLSIRANLATLMMKSEHDFLFIY